MIFENIGHYLAHCRKESGLTQRDVAIRLNYSTNQYISNVERSVAPPSLLEMKKWSDFVEADEAIVKALLVEMYEKRINDAWEAK